MDEKEILFEKLDWGNLSSNVSVINLLKVNKYKIHWSRK
jgi:hypothetical protein